jgi:hypothetical protein
LHVPVMDTSFGVPPSSVFPDSRLHSPPFVSATTVAAEERGSLPKHGASRLERLPLVGEIASPGKVSWAWPGVSPGPESRVTPLVLLLQSTLNWKVGLCLCDYVQCRVQELKTRSSDGARSLSGDMSRVSDQFSVLGTLELGSFVSTQRTVRLGSVVSTFSRSSLGNQLTIQRLGALCRSMDSPALVLL